MSTVIPATDWFFVHKQLESSPIVHHVAAWRSFDGANLAGLVPVAQGNGVQPLLVPALSDVNGIYLHRDQLTEQESWLPRTMH